MKITIGDVILKIDRVVIKDVASFMDLVDDMPENLRLPVLLLRDGRTLFTSLSIR